MGLLSQNSAPTRQDILRGLLQDEKSVAYRGGLLPYLARTVTDPIDDVSEYEQLEWAAPGLLYEPLSGMAKTGGMLAGDVPVDPRVMTQTMLDAPLISGLLGATTGAAPRGAVLGANVFHGGPHRFAPEPDFPHGRPRLDKVGTGEGAQAYGHGFYSADAPGVATDYKVRLADRTGNQTLEDNTKIPSWVANKVNAGQADEVRQDFLGRIAEAERKVAAKEGQYWLEESKIKGLQEVVSAIDKMVGGQTASGGTLYKLDIPDAEVAKYLDYDKPLSEQPNIIKKLRAAGFQYFEDKKGGAFADFGDVNTATGKDVFDGLGFDFDEKGISEVLRKAGIPGLKYFDQGSRTRTARATIDGVSINKYKPQNGYEEYIIDKFKSGVPFHEIEKIAAMRPEGDALLAKWKLKVPEGTRNYVTWDQDVLDRSKMLERDGVTLGANKAPTAALPGLLDDVGINTTQRGNVLEITKIETPDNLRGQGLADQRLEQLIQQADADGTTLALTPSNAFGANKSRLTKWYKRHGFVPNKGRNKDFATRESMVRPPRNIELGANKAPTAALPGLLEDQRGLSDFINYSGSDKRQHRGPYKMRGLLGGTLYEASTPGGYI